MSLNATISRITESDRFPKSLSEWVVPAAATVTVLLGVNLVLKNSRKSNKPPVVTSWIPWLGSDWAIEADPDAFFAKAEYVEADFSKTGEVEAKLPFTVVANILEGSTLSRPLAGLSIMLHRLL